MDSVCDAPKLQFPEQDSPMPVAQGSSLATQRSVTLQDNTIMSVLENIIQISYLAFLKRTKMFCTLLSVSMLSK